jgi:hypothetical protein
MTLMPAIVGRMFGKTRLPRDNAANKALHLTAIPLRCIAAGELGRWDLALRSGPMLIARTSRLFT